MSQIAEKLYQVYRGTSQRLGFRASTASSAQPMLLIAAPPKGTGQLTQSQQNKLDGLLVYLNNLEPPSLSQLSKIAELAGDLPWGIWLDRVSCQEVGQLGEFNGDFIIFEATTASARLFQKDNLGKFLQISHPYQDSLLRGIECLPIDAVLFDSGQDFLTVSVLLSCYQLSAGLSKPLLLATSAKLTDQEVQMLWKAGVDGLVVREVKSTAELSHLAQAMKSLPPTPRKQRQGVILPYLEGGKI